MTSVVVLVLDVLVVMLIATILNIVLLDAPVWIIVFPLIPFGIIFTIWLVRKIQDIIDERNSQE